MSAILDLETLASNPIPTRSMPKAMFQYARSCARLVHSKYPGMRGYYDPEYDGPRADPSKYLYRPAFFSATIPQSTKLMEKISSHYTDSFSDASALILGKTP